MGDGGDHRRLGGDVDMLAPPRRRPVGERHHGAEGGLRPGPAIGLRHRHPDRQAAGLPGQRHGAAGGHHLEVRSQPPGPGAAAPEGGDGDVDQLGIGGDEGVGVEKIGGGAAGGGGFEQEIGVPGDAPKSVAAGLVPEIEGEEALVDVVGPPAGIVQIRPRRLDLDDVGPEVGEKPPGQPAQRAGTVENPVRP